MRRIDTALLTLGIVTTAALMVSPFADISATSALVVSGKTDISAGLAERTLAVHRSGAVSAPAAEVKPVELAAEVPEVIQSFTDFTVEVDNSSADEFESENPYEDKALTDSESKFEAETEPEPAEEPEPVEEASEDSGMTYLGTFTITAFCNCQFCCGSYAGSPTASGAWPTEGWTCACNNFPLGTVVYIDGIGTRCIEDRGDSIMDDSWIDLYFDDHDEAQSFGMRYLDVYITE